MDLTAVQEMFEASLAIKSEIGLASDPITRPLLSFVVNSALMMGFSPAIVSSLGIYLRLMRLETVKLMTLGLLVSMGMEMKGLSE